MPQYVRIAHLARKPLALDNRADDNFESGIAELYEPRSEIGPDIVVKDDLQHGPPMENSPKSRLRSNPTILEPTRDEIGYPLSCIAGRLQIMIALDELQCLVLGRQIVMDGMGVDREDARVGHALHDQ